MSSRKGQFYMIDAFFAAFILFIGIGMVVSSNISGPQETQTQQLSADITSLMIGGELSDVVGSITIDSPPLANSYTIDANSNTDYTLSPAQQAAQWIEDKCPLHGSNTNLPDDSTCMPARDDAQLLADEILQLILQDTQSGVSINISDTLGNSYEILREIEPATPQTKQIVRKHVFYTPAIGGGVVGPLILDVRVWQ